MENKNKILGSFWNDSYTDDNYWDEMKAQDLANLEKLKQVTKKMKNSVSTKQRAKMHNKDYVKTAEGLASQLANQTKASSKRRGFDSPSWNTAAFRNWLSTDTNYDTMYANWNKASHVTILKPTIQRIDTNEGFSLDNMKVVLSKNKRYEK